MIDYEKLCEYLLGKPGGWQDMPFGPDALVFKVLNKMYALVAWQSAPMTISLKADPVDALILRKQYDAVNPGYHMNKKHWNTVTLDGSIPDAEVRRMIDESYSLVVQGMTRTDQARVKRLGTEGGSQTH